MEYDTLALSGGGLNGLALLGALQYCKDKNLLDSINTFVGTSIGSMICYLLIIGYTPVEIIVNLCVNSTLFDKLSVFDVGSSFRGDGAVSFSHIEKHLEDMTIAKTGKLLTMKKLSEMSGKKLVCVTYNITKTIVEYIASDTHPDIDCITALRMSCNLPLIFEHYKYGDCYYIDGGVYDSFPIEPAQEYGERVLGICLCGNHITTEVDPYKNIKDYVLRILWIFLYSNIIKSAERKRENTTLIMLKNYEHQNISTFAVNSKTKLELFSAGYEETRLFLNI